MNTLSLGPSPRQLKQSPLRVRTSSHSPVDVIPRKEGSIEIEKGRGRNKEYGTFGPEVTFDHSNPMAKLRSDKVSTLLVDTASLKSRLRLVDNELRRAVDEKIVLSQNLEMVVSNVDHLRK